jgi:hypothetical protein
MRRRNSNSTRRPRCPFAVVVAGENFRRLPKSKSESALGGAPEAAQKRVAHNHRRLRRTRAMAQNKGVGRSEFKSVRRRLWFRLFVRFLIVAGRNEVVRQKLSERSRKPIKFGRWDEQIQNDSKTIFICFP